MKHLPHHWAALCLVLCALAADPSRAQITFSEDFTGAATANNWYFLDGACLTAGTVTSSTSPGLIPSCTSVLSSYYHSSGDPYLDGGYYGYLGSSVAPSSVSAQQPDPAGGGALRFTNGSMYISGSYKYGFDERGAILSTSTFPTGSGIQVTFKTVTYHGNGGGAGGDGADGISFFLQDGSQTPGVGAFGGSLAYSCSNSNTPHDGLTGGYIGLGIDEYGNFLNGTYLVSGYTGSNTATGDNTAYGYGYKPDRIGLRGAGSVSWAALTAAYGTNPNNSALPYYPASLATTCSNGGVYNASTNSCGVVCTTGTLNTSTNTCDVCAAGATFYQGTNTCNSCTTGTYNASTNSCSPAATCASGGTYNASTHTCSNECASGTTYNPSTGKCDSCPSANGSGLNSGFTCSVCPTGDTYDSNSSHGSTTAKPCAQCPSGYAYSTSTGKCTKTLFSASPTWVAQTTSTATAVSPVNPPIPTLATATPTTVSPLTGATYVQSAVQKTCSTGNLYNYSNANSPSTAGTATLSNPGNTAKILDYAPIPGAYKELTSFQIANESATTRSAATPIFYSLKITQDGLLSLAYSVSGGAYSYLIKNQSITASNGPLPATFRVGFAGSDGGSSNIHEIMCFKAASAVQSGSSATVNEKEAAKVEAGTQAYFAYYNPNNWTGAVTANNLIDTSGVITVATTANWDASCLLTGTAPGTPATGGGCATTNASGPTSATPAPAGRIMLTWDTVNNVGIPFEWNNLNAAEQAALDFGDPSVTTNRLNYLRGDRSNEINSQGVGLYRARDGVLGDIVDSSPTWVGPPSSPYTATWKDRLYPGALMKENSGTQNYVQFSAAEQTRLNVVYVGANDGFLHGFRAGGFDVNGNFVSNGTTPNDGQEVLAYLPGSMLTSPALSSAAGGCTNDASTQTQVQGIHGLTPAVGANPACVEPLLDYSNSQYGHNFFIDATPGSGDLFYGGQWHSWLVGGLGVGGDAIYALDVTHPSGSNFTESNASSIVIGEWNPTSLTCANVANCGKFLGNTFGTPQIRRLHNGNWGVIFGNGFGSSTGDAGIYVMSIDSTTGEPTFYYLSTNTAGNNGIAYVTPADLDSDHITDYVYAGDLLGHVWRFDLTSNNPNNWAAGSAPLFTTQAGQPITTQLLVVSSNVSGGLPRLLIEFGTGRRIQLTNLAPVQYQSGVQSLYGVWDWNLSAWNTLSSGSPYTTLAPTTIATGLDSPYTLTYANLQGQTLTPNASNGVVDGTNLAVCWQGTESCGGTNDQFGWYANLPSSDEQIIFNPVFYQGAFVVNSTVPANNVATSCESNLDTGYTYALAVANGGVFTNTFPTYSKSGTLVTDAVEAGVATNATGSVYIVTTPQGTSNIVYQTISGTPGAQEVNIPPNTKAKRLTWIEHR